MEMVVEFNVDLLVTVAPGCPARCLRHLAGGCPLGGWCGILAHGGVVCMAVVPVATARCGILCGSLVTGG